LALFKIHYVVFIDEKNFISNASVTIIDVMA
jgi:hypothetical protein